MNTKRVSSRLIALILALALLPLSLAEAAAPGDTVHIPVPYYINGTIALTRVRVSFSLTDGLSYGGENGGLHEVMLPVSPPSPSGTVYLPILVNANAAAMGDQMVDIYQVVGGDDSGLDTAGEPAIHTIQVSEHSHVFGPWEIVTMPTWTATGTEQRVCSLDASHVETRDIPLLTEDQFGPWTPVKAATYEEKGLEERTWNYNSTLKESREIPVLPIIWGEWQTVTPATYEAVGLERRVNTLDAAKFEEREIPKKQIIWGAWQTVTPATYEAAGLERRENTLDADKFEEREIPKKQIIWGEWQTVTPATYEAVGLERRVNTLDAAKFEEREIPKKQIIWGEWQTVTPATCTQEGLEKRVAVNDTSRTETRALPRIPHQEEAAWIVTVLPTFEQEGLRILRCKIGGDTLKTERIPMSVKPAWTRSNLVAAGPEGTSGAPLINLARDGSQTLRLVDEKGTIMGRLIALVQNGLVTFSYDIFPPFTATGDTFSLSDPQRGTMVLPFNKIFSIAKDLGGWTSFTLYVNLQAENPEALAKQTSSNPTMPTMAELPIDQTMFTGDINNETSSLNADEWLGLQALMDQTALAQKEATDQTKLQDMQAKVESLLNQSDSITETATERFTSAILDAAIQLQAGFSQLTNTGQAAQSASDQEKTQNYDAKVEEMRETLTEYLRKMTEALNLINSSTAE